MATFPRLLKRKFELHDGDLIILAENLNSDV